MSNKNKVAVITSGAQGIGFAIAERLFNDGFKISIVDYNENGAKEAAKKLSIDESETIAVKADVSNRDQVFDAVQETVDAFGDLNVLVSNAGIGPTTPIDTITEEQFQNVYGVNVSDVIWGIQDALKQFRKLGHGGKIINAASQAGVVGNTGLSLYSSTKFAVRGLTQVAAQDLAKEDITVNAYAPGIVNTPMMKGIAKGVAKNAGKPKEWGWEQFTKDISLKRLSEPEDVAKAVGFLAGRLKNYC